MPRPAFFTVGQVPGVTDHAACNLERAARGLRTVFVSCPTWPGRTTSTDASLSSS